MDIVEIYGNRYNNSIRYKICKIHKNYEVYECILYYDM